MPYVIKRYPNRKLYDPQTSRYVTLDDLKKLIQDGAELRVEGTTNGEDLTSQTLAQILLEGERTHQAALPTVLLHQLIRNGEAWYDFIQQLMRTGSFDQFPPGKAEAERFWSQWTALGGWPLPGQRRASEPVSVVGPPAASPRAKAPQASVESEISALKAKLSALEQRVVRKRPSRAGQKRPAQRSSRRR